MLDILNINEHIPCKASFHLIKICQKTIFLIGTRIVIDWWQLTLYIVTLIFDAVARGWIFKVKTPTPKSVIEFKMSEVKI